MKATFYSLETFDGQEMVVGTCEAQGRVAVPSDGIEEFLAETNVVEPGNPGRVLTFEDGAEYVRALPENFRGTYFWAALEEP